jgi:hypothetical protein
MKKQMHTSVESAVAISVVSLVVVALGSILVFNGNGNITYETPSAVSAPSLAKTHVTVRASVGGITDPTASNFTYPAGTILTLNATAKKGFFFETWIITSTVDSDGSRCIQNSCVTNPLTIQCHADHEYVFQAMFKPTTNKTREANKLN